jgi:hypothetical protein
MNIVKAAKVLKLAIPSVAIFLLLPACSSVVKNTTSATPSPEPMEDLRTKVLRLAERHERCGQVILEQDALVKMDGTPAKEIQEAQEKLGVKLMYLAGSLRRLAADEKKLSNFKSDAFFHTLKTTNLDALRGVIKSDETLKDLNPSLKKRFEDENACLRDIITAEWDLVGFVETQTVKETRAAEAKAEASRETDITAKRHAECVEQRKAAGLDTAPCAEWAKER